MRYSDEQQTRLLDLARESLSHYVKRNTVMEAPQWARKEYDRKQGCFVTIKIDGKLRGCIGTIEPVYPLYEGIIKNAVSAGVNDPRFPPVTKRELERLEFEVSILSVAQEIEYEDSEKLLDILENQKPGVILSKGIHSSTFLPQVWQQLPDPQEFLSNLCLKAGLRADEWKHGDVKIHTYTAEVLSE